MSRAAQQLEALRHRIAARNEPDIPASYVSRLAVTAIAECFDLDYYGDSFGEAYLDLLETLAQPDIAPHIRSLMLRGPDEGANGTHNWDLEPLFAKDASFARLETFEVRQNSPGDHNRSIVGVDYEEAGVIGRLLASSPLLRELTVPSAPGANFFAVGPRPIRFLSIDAGYATQSFIRNLAGCTAFGELATLEWGEYNETYMDDFRSDCTPLEHYHVLFQSKAFSTVTRFVWRNPVCTADEIQGLKQLRPDLQLLVVRTSADYVRR